MPQMLGVFMFAFAILIWLLPSAGPVFDGIRVFLAAGLVVAGVIVIARGRTAQE